MIYLDNAATSFPKPNSTYESISTCLLEYCANPGRGGHQLSIMSGKAVIEAREIVSNFFNIKDSMRLSFTKNATEALNIAIKGVLKQGDNVITTSMEHNSVIRPLKTLEHKGFISLSIVKCDSLGRLDPEDIRKKIISSTKLIVCTLSSNVNGMIMPIKDIAKLASEHGLVFLLDASQGAGTELIDVEELSIDLLAFPGHKGLLGPQGTGGLYVKDGIELETLMEGGTGSNSENLLQPQLMPDVLESGTLNTPGIVGLKSGIEFINTQGIEKIKSKKADLIKYLQEGISEISGAILYSCINPDSNSGIVAANFGEHDSNEISYILDSKYGIATRAGLHCSPLAHYTIGTLQMGLVRFSPGFFNTKDEIDYVLKALREISMSR